MSNPCTETVILPWPEMQKKAERDGVDIMDYVNSMHAHVLNQRDEIKSLRGQLEVCRSAKAQAFQQLAELEAKVKSRGY